MTCDEILIGWTGALTRNMSCKEWPNGRSSVVLPFLYPDHDNIEIFFRQSDGNIIVSDIGETLRRLDTIGMDVFSSGKLAFQTERIASGFGVEIEEAALRKEGSVEQLGDLLFDVLSACMAIGDLAYGSRSYQPLTFAEEVANLLTVQSYSFEKRAPVTGRYGTIYHVDFRVTTQRRVSNIQTLAARTTGGAKSWVNATYRMWSDIVTGGEVARKVSLLNDEHASIKSDDIKLLESVSDVYLWKDRQKFLASLQNDRRVDQATAQ